MMQFICNIAHSLYGYSKLDSSNIKRKALIYLKINIKSKDCIAISAVILFISIAFNIYSACKIYGYKYNIGQESYVEIEEIRQRNESIMDILNTSIDSGSIRNDEILKLYKNYDVIASNIIKLWQQYADYTQRSVWIFSKNIESNKVIENDIHGKIKEYMLSTLSKEMKNEQSRLVLEDKDLECFREMEDMSVRIYEYFNEFNNNVLNGYTGESKEKRVIKKHYWIDMLNGIHHISNDYIDVNWNIEAEDQLTVDIDT